jgi:hypothetical protein
MNEYRNIGDKMPGHCCPGFDWVVIDIYIRDADKPEENVVWGRCDNPACTTLCSCGDSDCIYNRVSYVEMQELLEAG